jgi:glucan-binding YG repeat protein
MVLGTAMTASAAGSLKIRLDHGNKSSWTDGIQTPVVTVNFSEETPEWSKDPEKWEPGKKVTATIRVPDTYTSSDCTVYGGKLVSVKAEDGESVIKVSYIPAAKLEGPEKAGWSDTAKTKASWKKVPFASRYQIVLYKEGGIWVKSLTTSSTNVDLLQYMENGQKYYYTVKAILKDSSEEDYLKEGELVTSDDSVIQVLGETEGAWAEYKNGKKYRAEDGSYATNCWKMISGKWYYFNNDSFAATGWQYLGERWYYLGSDATMVTGWQQVNGKWYFLNPDGDMAMGWIQPQPGKWYYLYTDGSMAADTKVSGVYSVDSSGLWVQ